MLIRCYGCMTTYESTNGICPECGYAEGTPPENPQHLVPGIILNNRFVVGKVVGYGGFGVTYLGWDKLLAQKVAIKEYLPSEFSTRVPGRTCISIYEGDKREQFISGKLMFVEEAKKLAKFTDCQGIVKVFDSFVENDTAYIVMEYVDGTTLEEYFVDNKVFDPEEAVLMMLPVIESLKKVHESNVIHRDIAPNNIMVSKNGDVKLIDFGAARFASATHTKSMTVMIKPGYSPEEQYMSRGDQGPYTDVYALGATLYRMLTGVVPPDAMERRAKFQSEGKDILEPISKYNKNVSKNLENAIMNAMNVEIATRTKDMDTLLYELTTEKPVARRNGKIKLIDLYKWPRWLKVTIPAAMVFILTISTLFGMGFIGFNKHLVEEVYIPEGMVKVPWVVNKMEQDATRMLEGTKLIMTATAGEYSDEIAAGMVMAQETSAGSTVLENSRIYVTLSRGIEMKTIPSSVALYTEAVIVKQVLEDLGFAVVLNEETEYSTIPKGLLTKMVLEDGTIVEANDDIAKGKTIILTMSLGLDPSLTIENQVIKVPDFMNKSKVEAYTLAGDSIRIEIQDKYKAGVDTGIIWYQSVDAGTEMENTETIVLYASVSNKVKVPEVIGINYEKAISELQAVGLSYKIERREHENYAKDMVFEQSVAQGTMLEKGTEITLIVSDGPSKQDVPDVSGMKAEDAKNKLSSLGFAVSINYADSSTVAKGNVISQNIVGAKIAIKGDVIVLTVSSHEAVVAKHEHSWQGATCTSAKKCSTCGATEGNAKGHDWQGATCTSAKQCSTCGTTEGSALGHDWQEATCTSAKRCSRCGTTEGNTLGHNWGNATCTSAKQCTTCGATEGNALGHSWQGATCTDAKKCSRCGTIEGNALGHSWQGATCTSAKRCSRCGATEGNALGHSWQGATCTSAKRCSRCGATEGNVLGHDWQNATCASPKKCNRCGTTEGVVGNHIYDNDQDATCNYCGLARTMYTYFHWKDANGKIAICPHVMKYGDGYKAPYVCEKLTISYPLTINNNGYSKYQHVYWTTSCPALGCGEMAGYANRYVDGNGVVWFQMYQYVPSLVDPK